MTTAPTPPAPAPTPVPGPNRHGHHHTVVIAAMTSGMFAFATGAVLIFGGKINASLMSFFMAWWPLFGISYLLTQVIPLISFNPLEENRERMEILSTPIAAAVVFLLVPGIYLTSVFYTGGYWPNYWQMMIWLYSAGYSALDMLVLLILYRISRATVRTTPV